jgi:hypothetical protein
MHANKYFIIILFFSLPAHAYFGPFINLGGSSFLDGGPLRQRPGWYLQQVNEFYHTDRLLDGEGKLLFGVPSPRYNTVVGITQVIYQTRFAIVPKGRLGFEATLPYALYSHVQKNSIGINTSGAGMGDLVLGVFIQSDAIFKGTRPVFVHRVEFNTSFPTGKNKEPLKFINPGNGVYFIDPYWAATLYFNERFSGTWRLHYLWVSRHPKTRIQYGQAMHLNFALEYAFTRQFYFGLNGYWLKQLQNSNLDGVPIPDSKEYLLALGVGALYSFDPDFNFVIFANFYAEFNVHNRPQGVKAVLRFFKFF